MKFLCVLVVLAFAALPAYGEPPLATQRIAPLGFAGVPSYRAAWYTSWSVYRSSFTPNLVDVSALTHLIYAFAKPMKDGRLALFDPGNDVRNFKLLKDMKSTTPGLKTIIGIGGATLSDAFPLIAADENLRLIFARECINFMRNYGFDGLNIDWEYPGVGREGAGVDSRNFTLLLEALREERDRVAAEGGERFELSASVGPLASYIARVEAKGLASNLDFLHIMAYNFSGNWSTRIRPQSSLADSAAAIARWSAAGVDASKLVLGVPLFGKSWLVEMPSGDQTASIEKILGPAPARSREAGTFAWEDLGALQSSFGAERDVAHGSLLFRDPDAAVVVSIDDAQALIDKADTMSRLGVAGVVLWELSFDRGGERLEQVYSTWKAR